MKIFSIQKLDNSVQFLFERRYYKCIHEEENLIFMREVCDGQCNCRDCDDEYVCNGTRMKKHEESKDYVHLYGVFVLIGGVALFVSTALKELMLSVN